MTTADGTYRGYDLKELDRQYNPSQGIPDYARFLEAYLEDSRRATDSLHCLLDVPYGPGPHETLDIFPAARAHAPRYWCSSTAATGRSCTRTRGGSRRRRSWRQASRTWR